MNNKLITAMLFAFFLTVTTNNVNAQSMNNMREYRNYADSREYPAYDKSIPKLIVKDAKDRKESRKDKDKKGITYFFSSDGRRDRAIKRSNRMLDIEDKQ